MCLNYRIPNWKIQLKIQEKTIGDLKNIVDGQQKLLVQNNLDQLVNLPWEEGQDVIKVDTNENDQDEINCKSLREYENEDLKIDDLVYDDEEEEEEQHSGSFEMQHESKKREKEDDKADRNFRMEEKVKSSSKAKNMEQIEEIYGERDSADKERFTPRGKHIDKFEDAYGDKSSGRKVSFEFMYIH